MAHSLASSKLAQGESDAPPFDITQPRYDTKTYFGRVRHFASITSPLTLLASPTDLKNAQRLLKEYQEGTGDGRKAWGHEDQYGVRKAKQLVDSSIHPDTGEPVPLPFRLSAFVPTNLVIVAGMLAPNPSLKSVIFWQWANQSLNGALGKPAYAAATLASCSIAVGLSQLVPRLRVSPSARALLSKLVPFAAVASAGCVNIGLMRWKEMRDGISVFKPSDPKTGRPSSEELGKSSIAGAYAVGQTAASRVLTNIPTLILPPILMTLLEKRGVFNRANGRRLNTVTHIGVFPSARFSSLSLTLSRRAGLIGLSLLVFLPPAIAAFPSRASISPKKLEERFHEVPFEQVEFNKGL
ncbi:mitochondrial carrier protein, tricarboxylate/iron carrier [Rhodotorula toruloides]|uniref:Mitochondrial carrier protein, tricarboxylate/iron carrier n=1 Tax=Rhodotorula toruloides TaxID=5286 RepID=A0A511KF35_RHOTO|nr:mitochondrial carrier protein, tricarboxylate/iron carrier [Rhodotorula toruloides]